MTAMRMAVSVWAMLTVLGACPAACQQRQFPRWEVAPIALEGTWEGAPTVVIGEVRNITAVGDEPALDLQWPAGPWIKRIYWCEADFYAYAPIKGTVPARGKKYLWGAIRAGCKLDPLPPDSTRVWFIREEGDYIRPVVDAGGRFYLTFRVKWDYKSSEDPETQFGRLLLNPKARNATIRDFAEAIDEPASTACFILGKARCVEEIRALTSLGDPDLTRAACDFLSSQYQEKCEP